MGGGKGAAAVLSGTSLAFLRRKGAEQREQAGGRAEGRREKEGEKKNRQTELEPLSTS